MTNAELHWARTKLRDLLLRVARLIESDAATALQAADRIRGRA